MQWEKFKGKERNKEKMAEVKVLLEGYAKQQGKGWLANATVCLVTTDKYKIITDPGCNREKLLEVLNKEGLSTKEIDYVFMSHKHPDHILLAGIFENAKHITYDTNLMFNSDLITEFDKHELGEDIEIIETPGHVLEHISLIVNTQQGKVGIVGDVIWWLDSEEQVFNLEQKDHSQAKGMNMQELIESRKKVLTMSDYIIPGHGKMFKVEEKYKN